MLQVASLLLLSFALLACSSVKEQTVASIEIIRIDPSYMEDQDFKRIGEYLTGVEKQGNVLLFGHNLAFVQASTLP